jgi:hypothetical protein
MVSMLSNSILSIDFCPEPDRAAPEVTTILSIYLITPPARYVTV